MTELEFYTHNNRLGSHLVSEKLLLTLSLLCFAAGSRAWPVHLMVCLVSLTLLLAARIPLSYCFRFYSAPLALALSSLFVARVGGNAWLPDLADFTRVAAQLMALAPLVLTTPVRDILGFLKVLRFPAGILLLGHDIFILLGRSWYCFEESRRAAELRKGPWNLKLNTRMVALTAAGLQRRLERRLRGWEQALSLRGGANGLLVAPDRWKPRVIFVLLWLASLTWVIFRQ